MKYNRSDFDYAAWERGKMYPLEHIVISARRRPLLGRVTVNGWLAIGILALGVLVLVWGGL